MAGRVIEFDVEKLIGKLDILQKVQLPYAGNRALNKWAYAFSKQQYPQDVQDIFDRPVPRTTSAANYKVEGLEATIFIKDILDKGQSAAAYLYPVSSEDGSGRKAALDTRFTKYLRKLPDKRRLDGYAVPNLGSSGIRLNQYGNVSPGQYQQIIAGLNNKSGVSGGYRYISVPLNGSSNLSPGIYRVKGRGRPENLFNYTRTQPTVPTIFDLARLARDHAELELPTLLSNALRQALNR